MNLSAFSTGMNFKNKLSMSFTHLFKHSFKMVAAFAFECKEQKATSNETQTLRITKKQCLKMLTFAKQTGIQKLS